MSTKYKFNRNLRCWYMYTAIDPYLPSLCASVYIEQHTTFTTCEVAVKAERFLAESRMSNGSLAFAGKREKQIQYKNSYCKHKRSVTRKTQTLGDKKTSRETIKNERTCTSVGAMLIYTDDRHPREKTRAILSS